MTKERLNMISINKSLELSFGFIAHKFGEINLLQMSFVKRLVSKIYLQKKSL